MMFRIVSTRSAVAMLLLALGFQQWQATSNTRADFRPTDPSVSALSERFEFWIMEQQKDAAATSSNNMLSILYRGVFQWDKETFLWNQFTEQFASNPHSPYMYSTLPILGPLMKLPLVSQWLLHNFWTQWFLPSPMWRLYHNDAVVLLAREPPKTDYFSITTFCLWSRRRGFVFGSLGDSLNSKSITEMKNGTTNQNSQEPLIFAHVVVTQSSQHTLQIIQQALAESGLPLRQIHVAVIPNELIDQDSFAFFEVVMRLFQIEDISDGYDYLHSRPPVYYIQGAPPPIDRREAILPKPSYKERSHPDSVDEHSLLQRQAISFESFQKRAIAEIAETYQIQTNTNHDWIQRIPFAPLYIRGLHCINNVTACMGDCPDAAYFGTNIQNDSDRIVALQLQDENELHLLTMVDHRQTNAATYSSIAVLKSPSALLNKTHMKIKGTSMGLISNTHAINDIYLAWVFTRNLDHCRTLDQNPMIRGCTVLDEKQVSRNDYFAYCERVYLNPVTGTGPDWGNIVPAQLYHMKYLDAPPMVSETVERDQKRYHQKNVELYQELNLQALESVHMKVFRGEERFRWLHIIKTGGEALEGYINSLLDSTGPQIDYATCRAASMANFTSSRLDVKSTSCWTVASTIGVLLCGLNCECCMYDIHETGRFHGTMLRSPRAHTLSLFSHGHNAHHPYWKRIANDVPLYLAEGALRLGEAKCGHTGTGVGPGVGAWQVALEENLKASLASWPLDTSETWKGGVQTISLRNTQSHSLTCSKKKKGSIGQHFRVIGQPKKHPVDTLEPDLEEALEALQRIEWIGLTDLFHESLCLLHFQTNQTIPMRDCDCRHEEHHTNNKTTKPLGYWVEYRNKPRSLNELSTKVINMIDEHTTVDVKVYSQAFKLVLGRLQRVEDATGIHILECIDWQKLKKKIDYIPGLWTGETDALFLSRSSDNDDGYHALDDEGSQHI